MLNGDPQYSSLPEAVDAFRNGEVDDIDRENEGDLIVAAAKITTQSMAFLIKHTSGYICAPLSSERLEKLNLPPMVQQNQDTLKTAYTVTCDYRHGTTTGISAHDRALTVSKLADDTATADDFLRPGHVVPLQARAGGLATRRGHTEAGIHLCALAELPLGAAIGELVKPDCLDGSMARRNDCAAFAKQYDLKMITIESLTRAPLPQ